MFDARSILDALVRGSAQGPQEAPSRSGGDLGGIGDLLKQLQGADERQPAERPRGQRPSASRGVPVDESDTEPDAVEPPRQERRTSRSMPRQAAPEADDSDAEAEQPAQRRAKRSRRAADDDAGSDEAQPGGGGGLEDILRDVLGGKGGGIKDILDQVQKHGGLGEVLGPVLGQIFGQKGGGARLVGDDAGGAAGGSGSIADRLGALAGRSPEEIVAQIKALIANNQFGAGMAAGGLGALVLGTQTGRSLAASAAKLGGLALIGGLAYTAYNRYQQGTPATATAAAPALLAPPAGSGFESAAVTHDTAATMVRAMVAAAAADGRIDAREQAKLAGSLGSSGMSAEAQAFLAREIASPASVDDLAAAVGSQEEAVQVYTAARITVDPDIAEEHAFLAALAEGLGLEPDLVAQIDATARGAAA